MFHFFTHAFFKALLFLGAGVIIHAMNVQDMSKMGGIRRLLPVTFWTFLIGSASLAALPFVTAGFYSKDLILWDAYSSPFGSPWLYAAGLAGAFLTAVYTFRMVFLTFFGQPKTTHAHHPTLRMEVPLVILAVLSIIAGFIELPPALGNVRLFSSLMSPVLPEVESVRGGAATELSLALLAGAVSLVGIALAYWLFLRSPRTTENLVRAPWADTLRRYWLSGWGFDWLYNRLFVWPYIWLAKIDKDDIVDSFYDGVAYVMRALYRALSVTQTGRVRWYALGLLLGAVILVAIVVIV